MDPVAFDHAFRESVLPALRTWPFVRVWQIGCGDLEEIRMLGALLEEGGLGYRSRIYATGVAADEGARPAGWFHRNVVFWPHNLATDGTFNEFNLIISQRFPLTSARDPQQRVHRLIDESLCVFGILALPLGEAPTGVEARYEALDALNGLFRKVS